VGLVICDKHGRSPLAFACVHLRTSAAPLFSRTPEDMPRPGQTGGMCVRWVFGGQPGAEPDTFDFALCSECAARASVSLEQPPAASEKLFMTLGRLVGTGECSRCEEERWDRSVLPVVLLS